MKKIFKAFSVLFIVLFVFASIAYGLFFRYYNMLDFNPIEEIGNRMKRTGNDEDGASAQEDIPAHLYHEDGIKNVLLVGTDIRKENERGRSDTVILMSVDTLQKKIILTSFMRDTYLVIPGLGKNRLNAAYNYGGTEKLIDTIESNFDIYIDDYLQVDFEAFIEGIDAVGGVEIDVSSAEIENMNISIDEVNKIMGIDPEKDIMDPYADAGLVKLNGAQALAYARIRHVGNADFERTERQRRVLTEAIDNAKKMDVFEIDRALRKILPNITTDVSQTEILSYLKETPNIEEYEVITQRVPADETLYDMRVLGMAVLGMDLEANKEMLMETIYGILPVESEETSEDGEHNNEYDNNEDDEINGNNNINNSNNINNTNN